MTIPSSSTRAKNFSRPARVRSVPLTLVEISTPRNPRSFTQRSSRSEEHTPEPQSLMGISYAVFCVKKKKHQTQTLMTNDDYIYTNNTNTQISQPRKRTN